MKKIIFFSLIIVALFFLAGCVELSEDEAVDALAGQASRDEISACYRDAECRSAFLSCSKAECSNLKGSLRGDRGVWNKCIDQCLDAAQEPACVPYECVYQDYAGGIKDCGIIDDGCGGTVSCNYQVGLTGNIECPESFECINNQCTETINETCVPYECVYQDYAGGVKDCGLRYDSCGGTVNCDYQPYAGGVACPSGYSCAYSGSPPFNGTCNLVPTAELVCDVNDTLLEGEARTYTADGLSYAIAVDNFFYEDYAGGVHSVEFTANGETFTLLEDETYTLSDSGTITITEMLYQSYAGGVHSVDFCLNGGTGSSSGGSASTETIKHKQLFLLPVGVNGIAGSNIVGEILEYKSSDRLTKTSPRIKFKVWTTGDELIYALDTVGKATIRMGGKSFPVKVTNMAVDDSPIKIDFNNDGIYGEGRTKDLRYSSTRILGTAACTTEEPTFLADCPEGYRKYGMCAGSFLICFSPTNSTNTTVSCSPGTCNQISSYDWSVSGSGDAECTS